jgi:CheY-like chemotaxis protein
MKTKLIALIIDDNPANIDVLALLLRQEGIEHHNASSPNDAMMLLDSIKPPDLVFLDLEFPNYSGLEWIATLQADERLASAPFIAYTVHTSERNEANNAGFHSFIGKPLNVNKFPERIRLILSGIQVWEID